jgi:glycosyltransferase involved in cell wall biosynthesis
MLSIVIPAHDETGTLEGALDAISDAMTGTETVYEVIVVDDGSSDGTWSVVQQLAQSEPWRGRLGGVRFSRNFGKEAAIVAGLSQAAGDAVVVMDADLQHPPALIPQMVALWSRQGYWVVEAVKRQRQRESLLRGLSSRVFYRLLMVGAGLDLRNSTDFKLLDRRVVDIYLRLPEHGRFFRGLTAWIGLPTAQIEIDIPERSVGATRWSLRGLVRFARHGIVSFTALPLRLISWIGVLGLVLSLALTLQTLWNVLLGTSEAGFPTVILLILGIGSLILISLGIIGEYLSALYAEVKGRPLYVILDHLAIRPGTGDRNRHRS